MTNETETKCIKCKKETQEFYTFDDKPIRLRNTKKTICSYCWVSLSEKAKNKLRKVLK
mgnify:CR=1 FL=1